VNAVFDAAHFASLPIETWKDNAQVKMFVDYAMKKLGSSCSSSTSSVPSFSFSSSLLLLLLLLLFFLLR